MCPLMKRRMSIFEYRALHPKLPWDSGGFAETGTELLPNLARDKRELPYDQSHTKELYTILLSLEHRFSVATLAKAEHLLAICFTRNREFLKSVGRCMRDLPKSRKLHNHANLDELSLLPDFRHERDIG